MRPKKRSEHFYHAPGDYIAAAVHVSLDLHHPHPVVVLDHMKDLINVTCRGDGSILTAFDDISAYQGAKAHWALAGTESTVFITATSSCSSNGQNMYYQANSISFDDGQLACSIQGARVDVGDVVTSMSVDFGRLTSSGTSTYVATTVSPSASPTTAPPASAPFSSSSLVASSARSTQSSFSSPTPLVSSPTSTAIGTSTLSSDTSASGTPSIASVSLVSISTPTESVSSILANPPQATIDGFPAVATGPDFDRMLIDLLGYYAANNQDETSVLNEAIGVPLTRRSLRKRDNVILDTIDELTEDIEDIVDDIVDGIVNKALVLVNGVKTLIDTAITGIRLVVGTVIALGTLLFGGSYSDDFDFPIDYSVGGTNSDFGPNSYQMLYWTPITDPYGSAYQQAVNSLISQNITTPSGYTPYPAISVYCVECGASGDFEVQGSVSADSSTGLRKATIAVTGNLQAGLEIGISAFIAGQQSATQTLYVRDLGGWEIPDLVSLTPQFIVSVQTNIQVRNEGEVLAGIQFVWPSVYAGWSLLDSGSESNGWTPRVTKIMQASGRPLLSGSLAFPLTLSFDLELLNGAFGASANLTDAPGLSLNVDSFSSSCGTSYSVNLINTLQLDVSFLGSASLHSDLYNLAQGCVPLGGTISPPPSSSKLRRRRRRELDQRQDTNATTNSTTTAHTIVPADVVDSTGQIRMLPHYNGNLFLSLANTSTNDTAFLTGVNQLQAMLGNQGTTANQSIVYGDSQNRLFHYYPSTIDGLGVSRLRLAAWDQLPIGSRVVTLAPVTLLNQTFLVGVDGTGSFNWLYCCAIQDEPNKMFLVKDGVKWDGGAAGSRFAVYRYWWAVERLCAAAAELVDINNGPSLSV
ncbi:hypothetical protein BAUCODRAFT_148031 [Baudoinia panamericana UAMH 10762]|uniref:Uncharacterized protein n=1 Tax=Baudoinia panamericana (strain UAMH 10762) TaxID=717646 RepID=M2LPT5_BAUPA|nr:uncharacterized protein BAUCODRAFT_148031 [Baudoinia panamericana UAMH 10762]EMC96417.1 hypothetical protein BAUCODRAFT_148031 [Baudoinia panamericana UAMH 10762]